MVEVCNNCGFRIWEGQCFYSSRPVVDVHLPEFNPKAKRDYPIGLVFAT